MSKTHRDLAKMERAASEVDGEFCIPQEEGEVRHHIDLGPILGRRRAPGLFLLRKALLFVPAMFLFILAIQLMKTGAAAIGPSIEGSFPFANPLRRWGRAGSAPTSCCRARPWPPRRSACSAPVRSRSSRP